MRHDEVIGHLRQRHMPWTKSKSSTPTAPRRTTRPETTRAAGAADFGRRSSARGQRISARIDEHRTTLPRWSTEKAQPGDPLAEVDVGSRRRLRGPAPATPQRPRQATPGQPGDHRQSGRDEEGSATPLRGNNQQISPAGVPNHPAQIDASPARLEEASEGRGKGERGKIPRRHKVLGTRRGRITSTSRFA